MKWDAQASGRAAGLHTAERSQAILLVVVVSGLFASLILTVALGRLLSANDFGFFALVSAVFAFARSLADLGINNVMARETVVTAGDERQVLERLMGLQLAVSAVAGLACAILALLQPSAAPRLVLMAAAIVVCFFYINSFAMVFQVRQAQGRIGGLVVAVRLSTTVLCAALALRHVPGVWCSAVVVLREAGVLFAMQREAERLLGYRPRPLLQPRVLVSSFRLAAGYSLSSLLYNLTLQSGNFLVRFLRPAVELGAFAAAARPISPATTVAGALLSPLVPVLSRLAVQDRPAFERQAWGTLRLSLGVGSVIAVSGGLLAPAVLAILYGPQYAKGALSAVDAFRWLSAGVGLFIIVEALAIVLLSDRRERLLVRLSLAGFGVNLAAGAMLLPIYGFAGAGMALALSAGLTVILGLGFALPGLGGSARLAGTAVYLLPAGGLALALELLRVPPLERFLVGGALSALALVSLWRLPGVNAYRAEQARLSRPSSAPSLEGRA